MFKSPTRARERILVYGDPGSGKSFSYLTIARMLQVTDTPATVYVIDTDMAAERALSSEFGDLSNVIVYPAYTWEDYCSTLVAIRKVIRPDDWLCIDLICKAWLAAQEYYVSKVFKTDLDDYFLDARRMLQEARDDGKKVKEKVSPLDGWKDWTIINRLYNTWSEAAIMKTNAHIFACAKSAPVNSDLDNRKTMTSFGRLSVKPCGQKDLAYNFHTVLLSSATRDGYALQSAKDRGRQLIDIDVSMFAIDYLQDVAGWVTT